MCVLIGGGSSRENNTGKSGWSGCFQQTQKLKSTFCKPKISLSLSWPILEIVSKKFFLRKTCHVQQLSSKNTPHTWRKRGKKLKSIVYTLTILQESMNADHIFIVRPELSTTVKYLPDFPEGKVIVLTHLNLVSKPESLAHKHKTKVTILFLDSNSSPEGRHSMSIFECLWCPTAADTPTPSPPSLFFSLPTATLD